MTDEDEILEEVNVDAQNMVEAKLKGVNPRIDDGTTVADVAALSTLEPLLKIPSIFSNAEKEGGRCDV